ncbi:MAG: methyltransferase domain-containing protein [Candidatus Acidiferrum sp.]
MSAAGLMQLLYVMVADPRDVYHNVVVSLDRAKDINNGQPSALGRWIDALALKSGDRVFHLGCGAGYYTAIMAEVVGPNGRVVALELQPELAERARQNLVNYAHVRVEAGDGAAFDPGDCDAMLINCGVTHPQAIWLDRLCERGRLVVPFTMAVNSTIGQGVLTKITRSSGAYQMELVTVVGNLFRRQVTRSAVGVASIERPEDGRLAEAEVGAARCARTGRGLRSAYAERLLKSDRS